MKKYFQINFEFDHNIFFSNVYKQISKKNSAYICVVDANVLTMTRNNIFYKNIINSSFMNTCDGSSIAWFASIIHKKKLLSLNGPDILKKLINDDSLKHVIVGNTTETINRVKLKMYESGLETDNIFHVPLPFLEVNNFDYQVIASKINNLQPDIIWISLGAPKQEIFMNKILPNINQGVMFGIGAALNFYTGEIKMSKVKFFGLRFIWLNRLIADPFRLLKRLVPYLINIPHMLFDEIKNKDNGY